MNLLSFSRQSAGTRALLRSAALGTSAGNISDAWDVDRYVDGKVEDFAISKLKQGLGWFSRDAKNRQTPASSAAQSSGFGDDASELIFGGRPSISSQSDIDKFIHAKDEDIASLSSDFRRKSPAWARTDPNAHLDWLTDFSKLVTRWANDKATVSSNASRFQNGPVKAGKMLLASPIWAKDHGSFQDLWTRLRKVPEPAEAHAASHPQAPSQSSLPRQPQPQQQDPDPPKADRRTRRSPVSSITRSSSLPAPLSSAS